MTEEINNNLRNQEKIDDRKNDILLKGSNEIESQISNIVNVISQGFVQEGFKIKMEYLKKRKSEIEVKLLDIESREVSKVITEASVRTLLLDFSGYVIRRNILECKKFIKDFVKEVVVHKDRIEVTFNVVFLCLKIEKERLKIEVVLEDMI